MFRPPACGIRRTKSAVRRFRVSMRLLRLRLPSCERLREPSHTCQRSQVPQQQAHRRLPPCLHLRRNVGYSSLLTRLPDLNLRMRRNLFQGSRIPAKASSVGSFRSADPWQGKKGGSRRVFPPPACGLEARRPTNAPGRDYSPPKRPRVRWTAFTLSKRFQRPHSMSFGHRVR